MKAPMFLAFGVVALTPMSAGAHHGWSGQDNARVTVLEGAIEAVRYRNPHGEIDIAQGGERWTITLAPVGRMQSRGLTAADLQVGQMVKVAGHRNLNMSRYEMKANTITVGAATTSLR